MSILVHHCVVSDVYIISGLFSFKPGFRTRYIHTCNGYNLNIALRESVCV